MKIGVIISTYNNPRWLAKTLTGYTLQTEQPDEVIIADDGSKEETKELIDSFRDKLPIRHVWHEDRGFQKSEILNKAIMASEADYLIFTDQDCIPRRDFVATHKALAEQGRFLSGGVYKLCMEASEAITSEDIQNDNAFQLSWLKGHGQSTNLTGIIKSIRLTKNATIARIMNVISPRAKTFNGCNSSCWRADAIAVNGYDESLHYGGQDREFGMRLTNNGIRAKQIAFSAITLHLDHSRPYKTPESIEANKRTRRHTKEAHVTRTPNGIVKEQ